MMLPGWEFHHIGVACRTLEEGMAAYAKLGYEFVEPVLDEFQNVHLTISSNVSPAIELISPVDETSPVQKTLQRSGPGPYHVCYSVDSLETAFQQLKAAKIRFLQISEAKPAILFKMRRVVFLMIAPIGIIELVEND